MISGKIESVLAERDILRLISGIQVKDLFNQKTHEIIDFPTVLNRLVTTTKDDTVVCLVMELARGLDLVQFNRLLAPKLKWDPDPNVYPHRQALETFLKHISI